ncbi:MAG: ATP-binding protein [Gammaproteobacteria bacterium]
MVKYSALLLLVGVSFHRVFGDFAALQSWLDQNPLALERLYSSTRQAPWHNLNLAFCTSVVALPHLFHVVLSNKHENIKTFFIATWAFPACLLLVAFSIPVVLWMAIKLDVAPPAEYFLLGVAQHVLAPWGPLLVWLMALCASFAVLAISALTLSIMVSHYWVLPLYQPTPKAGIYSWLSWVKRAGIAFFLMAAYLFFRLTHDTQSLSDLVMLTVVGMLQFLPGIVGTLFWPRANRKGLLFGLAFGFIVWFIGLLLPILFSSLLTRALPFGLGYLFTIENWQTPAFLAFTLNAMTFVSLSLITRQSPVEIATAQNCIVHSIRKPYRWDISWRNVNDLIQRLTPALGHSTAHREVALALRNLGFTPAEQRPYALRRLRDQLESNLSALFGPALAQRVVDNQLPYLAATGHAGQDIYYIEQALSSYETRFSGLADTLDHLRRFHRQTVLALPHGVISLSGNGEIIGWNLAMERLSHITHEQVIGSKVQDLENPWKDLILRLISQAQAQALQETVNIAGLSHCLSLKATDILTHRTGKALRGMIIAIEDLTDIKRLESQLAHSERLASVGKLAAGVAHEIGNPLTAIACLSQELRSGLRTAHNRELVEELIRQTHRIRDIVQSLVTFSHSGLPPTQRAVPVIVSTNVDAAIQLTRLSDAGKKMCFINTVDSDLWILGDEQKFQQVFINVLSNARDASTPGDRIVVSSHESTDETAVITITDDGHGIPDSIKDTLFDPFVTTKRPGQGTGLGLSLVYSIVREFNGHIYFTSPVNARGTGTQVKLHFPRFFPEETTTPDVIPHAHAAVKPLTATLLKQQVKQQVLKQPILN